MQECLGLGDALLHLGKAAFGVGIAGDIDARQACRATFDAIAGNLHLAHQRVHIRRQARLKQHAWLYLARRGISLGLVQDGRQIAEHANENRNRGVIHGQ
ncbi:hypothetical protein D9M68_930320 [compost metagenome]